LHSETGIDLPSKAARPALVVVPNLVAHLHPMSAKLADLVRRVSFSGVRVYIGVPFDYVVLLGKELPDLVRRTVDGDALLYGYGGHSYCSFLALGGTFWVLLHLLSEVRIVHEPICELLHALWVGCSVCRRRVPQYGRHDYVPEIPRGCLVANPLQRELYLEKRK
jgi:hypothetical protein